MNIVVSGKNMQVGDSLTQRIERAISQLLEKYFSSRGEATIVLTKEHSGFVCDIKIHLPSGVVLHATSQGHMDATSVFAETEDKIAKQLRRYKRRLNNLDRTQENLHTTEYILKPQEEEDEGEEAAEDNHLIIAEQAQAIQNLSVSDAVMHMDLRNLNHLLFKNIGNNRLNLVYRRSDGHYGWMNPEQ